MENISEKSKKIVGARQLPRINVVIALAAMMQFLGAVANAADDFRFNSFDVTKDQIILVELKEDRTDSNLFDLENTTISFVPNGEGGYSVERMELQWNPDIGEEMEASFLDDSYKIIANRHTLENFEFPFSGDKFGEIYVSPSGIISFSSDIYTVIFQRINSGMFRYDRGIKYLSNSFFENTIAPLFWIYSPRNITGNIHVHEDSSSVTLTFSVSEPCCNLDAYTTSNNINDYQVKLDSSGQIDISYKKIESKAGVVGVFPVHEYGRGQLISSFNFEESSELNPEYDITNVAIYKTKDNRNLEFIYTFSGDLSSIVNPDARGWNLSVEARPNGSVYSTRGGSNSRISNGSSGLYTPYFSEFVSEPIIRGNQLFVTLNLTSVNANDVIEIISRVEEYTFGPGDEVRFNFIYPKLIYRDSFSRNIDFSTEEVNDLQSRIYEGFYHQLDQYIDTNAIMCAAIAEFGDIFTLGAHYSSFRLDNGAASSPVQSFNSPSKGIGIGLGFDAEPRDGPTFVGSCKTYNLQSNLAKIIPLGSVSGSSFGSTPYYYSSGLLTHEIGHTWIVNGLPAEVSGETIWLSQWGGHWSDYLHSPVPINLSGQEESSTMGGWNWVDNGDGTFTRYSSRLLASGFSYLDLYLMGLIPPENVPDFFIVDKENMKFVGLDDDGKALFRLDKLDVTIEDVIAANGPRFPTYLESPKDFNMAFTYVRPYGEPIDQQKLATLRGVRDAFFDHWCNVTGGLSTIYSEVTDKYQLPKSCVLSTDLGNGTEDPAYGVPYEWLDLDISDFASIDSAVVIVRDQDLNEGDTFSAYAEVEGTGIVDIYVKIIFPDWSTVTVGSDGRLSEPSEIVSFRESHVLESGVRQRIELVNMKLPTGAEYKALQKGKYIIAFHVTYEGRDKPFDLENTVNAWTKRFKIN